MSENYPKQEPPYGLRMPPDLKDRVKAAAAANNRSLNAEIVAALQESYPEPALPDERLAEAVGKLLSFTESIPDSDEKEAAVDRLIGHLANALSEISSDTAPRSHAPQTAFELAKWARQQVAAGSGQAMPRKSVPAKARGIIKRTP